MVTGEQILESSEVKFMNLAPYVFNIDLVAKVRSGLSIAVLEKKKLKKIIVEAINYSWGHNRYF